MAYDINESLYEKSQPYVGFFVFWGFYFGFFICVFDFFLVKFFYYYFFTGNQLQLDISNQKY